MMRTNSAVLLAATGFGGLILSACSDVLEPEVFGDLTAETFFSSEADFQSAVIALYNPFITDWGTQDQGAEQWFASLYNHDPKTYWARTEITADAMFTPWDATFENFTWGPATLAGDQMSNYAKIRYVARATDVIDKIEHSDADVADEIRAGYIAEAKALRGWLNFILYDFFGPVNSKLDPTTLSSTEIEPRPDAQTFVAAIERDLVEAIPDLRDRYNDDAENWGRIGAGTARMVLLRLYMHEKDWAKAEGVAREITQMGYLLLPSYADACNVERNNELIYAIPVNAASPNWYWMEIMPDDFASTPSIQREPGWFGYWMPWSFYDTFDPADRRLETVVAEYTTVGGATKNRATGMRGAIPLKCTTNLGTASGSDADWPVFRYAETLLSLAESINEQRGADEAYAYVNEVRARAGLPAWSGLSQTALRDSLLVERGRELYSEGVRRSDLIRHGKFVEYAVSRGAAAQPHHVLFPIPLEVIQQGDGVIEQNPGY